MENQSWLKQNWFKFLFLVFFAVFAFALSVLAYKYVRPKPSEPQPVKLVQVTPSPAPISQKIDLPAIIQEWYPSAVRIVCYIRNAEGELFENSGTGFLKKEGLEYYALTNKHVISGENGELPELCTIRLANNEEPYILTNEDEGYKDEVKFSETLDIGSLKINYLSSDFKQAFKQDVTFCSSKARLGTPIITIGYPTIGAETDITVTQGIVAGYDGDYYITDAKIGHGNSGGIAIEVTEDSKKACLIGVPSYSKIGEVENLGRILDIQRVQGFIDESLKDN